MGMYCHLRRLDEAELLRLIAQPEAVADFLLGTPETEPPRSGGLLWSLTRVLPIRKVLGAAAEPPAQEPPPPEPREDELDLEKAWHGLHFLFTGTAWEGEEPGCFLLKGGEQIGDPDDEDGFYAPPRAFRAEEVRRIAGFLDALTPEELARRHDPARMMELRIYPEIWTQPPRPGERGGSPFDDLLQSFAALRSFVAEAAARGQALIVCLT